MIIISIIITAPYSTVLKRTFQTTAFSTTILNILLCKVQWIQTKTSPYQPETELDVKDTLFEIYEGLVVLDLKCGLSPLAIRASTWV